MTRRPLLMLGMFACAMLVGACGKQTAARTTGTTESGTSLLVTIDKGETTTSPDTYSHAKASVRVACSREDATCTRLAREHYFDPPPKDEICSQQYGGPETATVTGTFRGRKVHAEFKRTNGCEIARWERSKWLWSAATTTK